MAVASTPAVQTAHHANKAEVSDTLSDLVDLRDAACSLSGVVQHFDLAKFPTLDSSLVRNATDQLSNVRQLHDEFFGLTGMLGQWDRIDGSGYVFVQQRNYDPGQVIMIGDVATDEGGNVKKFDFYFYNEEGAIYLTSSAQIYYLAGEEARLLPLPAPSGFDGNSLLRQLFEPEIFKQVALRD